jgi:hypothetical protein
MLLLNRCINIDNKGHEDVHDNVGRHEHVTNKEDGTYYWILNGEVKLVPYELPVVE